MHSSVFIPHKNHIVNVGQKQDKPKLRPSKIQTRVGFASIKAQTLHQLQQKFQKHLSGLLASIERLQQKQQPTVGKEFLKTSGDFYCHFVLRAKTTFQKSPFHVH